MHDKNIIDPTRYALICAWIVLVLISGIVVCLLKPSLLSLPEKPTTWVAPDISSLTNNPEGRLIKYGHELVAHTAVYLGPRGKVKTISNGMNCQNCHLKAGTLFFGNNYSAVASTYPKFRPRSGAIEPIEKRVNDCIERSLNGHVLSVDSKEMQAFVSYIKWIGKDVPKGESPEGSGLWNLPFTQRAADTTKGKIIYQAQCNRCHGKKGEGVMEANGVEWKYPPLWGVNSFTIGAGLYRLSGLAGYVKTNMPSDQVTYEKPLLKDEEAWDVAAYIISLPHPFKDISKDWPDISKKPIDHPFGPYADSYSETQHKYGPFVSILAAQKKND